MRKQKYLTFFLLLGYSLCVSTAYAVDACDVKPLLSKGDYKQARAEALKCLEDDPMDEELLSSLQKDL